MHLSVNLLPREERNEYRLEIVRRTLVFSGIMLILVFITFSILLGGIYTDLRIRTHSLEAEYKENTESFEGKRANEVQKIIRGVNTKVRKIETISKDSFDTLALIALITSRVGEGITLKELNLDVNAHTGGLSGFASTRLSLEKFRDALDNAPGIQDITLPTTSLLKRTDIDFNMTFKFQ